MRRDVFGAIADPARREILNMLAHQSLNIVAVAENFRVSRTAVYKHIKILTECGLVSIKKQGRERYCEAGLERLREVLDWVEPYRQSWNKRLNFLENYLNHLQLKNNTYRKNE